MIKLEIFKIDGQDPCKPMIKHKYSELKLFWILMIVIWYYNWYKSVEHGSWILMT